MTFYSRFTLLNNKIFMCNKSLTPIPSRRDIDLLGVGVFEGTVLGNLELNRLIEFQLTKKGEMGWLGSTFLCYNCFIRRLV